MAKKATRAAKRPTRTTKAAGVKRVVRKAVPPIPPGMRTVTPYLTVRGADRAIDFYRRVFGARELLRMPGPEGKLMHAEIRIGDSVIYLADEFPEMGSRSPESLGGAGASVHLYVRDADTVYERAVSAGAEVRMPIADMFWGDRYGKVRDPFGHEWGIATHKERLSAREIGRRAAAAMAQGGPS